MDRNDHPGTQPKPKSAAGKIPDKPRDCAPHVDTWPILDAQGGDTPRPKGDEKAKP